MKNAIARLTSLVGSLSPESAALILSVGLVLGTFPVYGCPTALCFLAVLCFRLNAPALYLVNQVSAPLQFALLVPFARVGARILRTPADDSGGLLTRTGGLALHAVIGWTVVALPLGLAIYAGLILMFRRHRCRPVLQ